MRKIAIRGFSASMVSLVALGLYSIAFKMEYQIPGVSGISVWNNYVLVRQAHVYDPSAIESAEMRADVDSLIEIDGADRENIHTMWLEREYLENKYGMVEFDKFVRGQITVWVGAPNEYKRLLAQNYPVLIAVSCWVQSQLARLSRGT